jgi:capsular exopolysaccharide synthesis family protein
MSKVFDVLKKGQGEAADLLLGALIENQTTVADAAPSLPENVTQVEPTLLPKTQPSASEIRSVPLHLSASAPLLPFDSTAQRSASEQYRILRTRIIQHARQPHMLVISSAGPSDGKSVTAVNLAGALSLKADSNVLLMDGDFRRPSIAKLLGIPEAPGVTDVLTGASSLEQAVIQVAQFPHLYVLPGGTRCTNPVELLDSTVWVSLCAKLRGLYRYIVVDSPPIAAVADYDLIQAACDGVIVVVRPDHTKRKRCFKALESTPKDKLIGIVLNCITNGFLVTSEYYGSYNYY